MAGVLMVSGEGDALVAATQLDGVIQFITLGSDRVKATRAAAIESQAVQTLDRAAQKLAMRCDER